VRVVLDTNVFVSSFFGGNPRKVIDLWKTGQITLCLSPDIVEEYVGVLERLGLKDERELEELLGLLAEGFNTVFTTKLPALRVVEGDPDDDKFVACAVAHKARFVVSGDKALIALKNYMGIKIVTPREFLREVA